jgi:hypothetical protein
VSFIGPFGGGWRIRVMVAIKYRNAHRPEEAGIVLVCQPSQAQETREGLERQGFIIVDEKTAAARSQKSGAT